jgi:hypothetical protein
MGLGTDVPRYPKTTERRKVCISQQRYPAPTKRSCRHFKWTAAQIQRLLTCRTAEDFRHALDTLPETLEDTYRQALEKVPEDDQTRVRKILVWLTSSCRELTCAEVATTVAFRFVEDVLRLCPSVLVTVSGENTQQTIKLAHFTVKEFLIIWDDQQQGLLWYKFTAKLAHKFIASQTLVWLFHLIAVESEALLDYARQF